MEHYVVKRIELSCGCSQELKLRPRESRSLLKVGYVTHCDQHGNQEIVAADEIDGNVPLLKEIIGQG